MMLLTKEIRAKLPKLGATEKTPTDEKSIIVKFFTPWSNWTWWAVEGEEQEGEFLFFGLVQGFETEWGYFALSELESAKGPMGLKIERDLHFDGKKIGDLKLPA
jgi:hypothetical protein